MSGTPRSLRCYLSMKGGANVEINNDNREYRAGAFFGLLAMVLVLALTAMALTALAPVPEKTGAMNWEI